MRVLVLLLLCWIVAEAVDGEARSWPIPRTQLAIAVPGTWTAQPDHAGAVLVLRSGLPTTLTGDAAERGRGIIAIAVQPVKDEQPFAFAVRCRTDLERTATGLHLGTQEEKLLGGHKWIKQPYRMQVGQFTFAQVLYATALNGTGICVTCSSSDEAFAQWQAAFDAAIETLGRSRLTIDLK
jgi:hypothetical protein